MNHVNVLVLGAGPCGLGAARQLHRRGETDWVLVEGNHRVGGLASSFRDPKGFLWDVGGHVQFSHYDYFDSAMDEFLGADGWNHHERSAWVWMRDRFIPYPLQHNAHRLPPDEFRRCVDGLMALGQSSAAVPHNFEQFLQSRFGEGLVEVFMRPYNEKVWAHPVSMLSAGWVGERVAGADVERLLRNAAADTDDISWGPNNTFRYPRAGGTGAIWGACASDLPAEQVMLGDPVVAIDLAGHTCTLRSGREIRYAHLVSTMPLTELLRMSSSSSLAERAGNGLLRSSTNIVGLGIRGRTPGALAGKSWMYFSEPGFPCYRATVFSNYSDDHVPDPNQYWSLMCEVSESAHRPVAHDSLVADVVGALRGSRLLPDHHEVVSTWQFRTEYGYPVPSVERDAILAEVIPHLEQHHVYSRGRFGMWKYEVSNQDHSFMQGVEVVERLLGGTPEMTAFDADLANSRVHPWPYEGRGRA